MAGLVVETEPTTYSSLSYIIQNPGVGRVKPFPIYVLHTPTLTET